MISRSTVDFKVFIKKSSKSDGNGNEGHALEKILKYIRI